MNCCGMNNQNQPCEDDGVTTLSQVGGGFAIGQGIIGDTLILKTLLQGSGITLSSNATTITISNSQVETNTITNLGAGAGQILVDVLAGSVRARTITSTLGIDVNTSGDLVTIEDDSIQTLSNSVMYNYGQATSVNLALSYSSPSGVVSNTGSSFEQSSGSIAPAGVSSVTYIPGARVDYPVFYNFTTLAGNGSRAFNSVKIYPNTTVAYDAVNNYTLAAGADGLLYQISPNLVPENRMINYDGSLVGLTDLNKIAFDIADNLLFYTQAATPNNIRFYDFSSGLDIALTTISSVSGWTAGAVVADMTFNQFTKTLYVQGDLANSRIMAINIRPFDRYGGTYRSSVVIPFPQPYSAVGSTNFSMVVDDDNNCTFAFVPAIGNTQVSVSNTIGSSTGLISTTNPEANTTAKRLFIGANGFLYCYSVTGNALYISQTNRSVGNGLALTKNLTRAYRSFTRSPYGIVAI